MSIEGFREVNRYKPHREKGYAGMPIDRIPHGLQERVRAAVRIAAGIDRLTPEVKCFPEGIRWQFGNQFTDVFVFDGRDFQYGFHRGPDGIIYRTPLSSYLPEYTAPIVEALGFDQTKAEIIQGFGWGHGQDMDDSLKEYLPEGPYYGMRIETPE